MLRLAAFAVALLCAPFTAHAGDNNPFSGAASISVTMARQGDARVEPGHPETCAASQYGIGDRYHGKRTASGERFNTFALTAAHRTRPFGSRVTVTNRRNGRSVVVRISDRGPFVRGRCIDLSRAAANAIGMGGTAQVRVQ
jgi:rare lipoprotein A